jgi:hypothetical protein
LNLGKPLTVSSVLGTGKAVVFTWTTDNDTTAVTVEESYPHRILAFSEPDGSHGELLSVRRLRYWKLHGNGDLHFRKELGLSGSMPLREKQ